MSEEIKKDRATYKDMVSSTKEDWDIISGMQEISIRTFP